MVKATFSSKDATSSSSGKADLARLSRALNVFKAEWEYFPVHVGLMFLTIAQADAEGAPLSVRGTAEATGMPEASVSRNIRVLSGGQPGRGGSVEHDLLEVFPDPTDYRARLIRLTTKGRAFYRKIVQAME